MKQQHGAVQLCTGSSIHELGGGWSHAKAVERDSVANADSCRERGLR